MRIVSFKTVNHPILGNCHLNFTNDGTPCPIILLAGANGAGKTNVLNEIYSFLTSINPSPKTTEVTIEFALSDGEVNVLRKDSSDIDSRLIVRFKALPDTYTWDNIEVANSTKIIESNIIKKNQSLFKVIYSTAEINFFFESLKHISTSDLDANNLPRDKYDSNSTREIAQLLADIIALDNQDAANWILANKGKNVLVQETDKRISRFKMAFEYMIEGKKFGGVKNDGDKKKIYFIDNRNKEIDISELSSGEKQIVFRAGYLLKNVGNLLGGIVLIDEPELSLHPIWQEKYLSFVKTLFKTKAGMPSTQIIIATHSPFIIQNNSLVEERVIVLERNDGNTVESHMPSFYGYTNPFPVYRPIDAPAIQLLLVEGKGDKLLLSHAWKRIKGKLPMPFKIQWAGEPNSGGANSLQRHIIALQQYATHKVLGLYDADEKGLNDYNGTSTKEKVDFEQDLQISNLKKLKKVGVSFLPTPTDRQRYFNGDDPKFSMLTLELFFADDILRNLGILESKNLIIGNEQFVRLKRNHTIADKLLEPLTDSDYKDFALLFDHIDRCFQRIDESNRL